MDIENNVIVIDDELIYTPINCTHCKIDILEAIFVASCIGIIIIGICYFII